MSPNKKIASLGTCSPKKFHQCSTDKAAAVSNRRHDLYRKVPSDRKEALLLQRRTRYQELNTQNLMRTASTLLATAHPQLSRQRGITITERLPHRETGNGLCSNSSIVTPGKGKNIIGCFSTFEIGSTPAHPTEQHHPNATIISAAGLAVLTHQWHARKTIPYKIKVLCPTNNIGRIIGKKEASIKSVKGFLMKKSALSQSFPLRCCLGF